MSNPMFSMVFSRRLRGTFLSGRFKLGARACVLLNLDSKMPNFRVSRILNREKINNEKKIIFSKKIIL